MVLSEAINSAPSANKNLLVWANSLNISTYIHSLKPLLCVRFMHMGYENYCDIIVDTLKSMLIMFCPRYICFLYYKSLLD